MKVLLCHNRYQQPGGEDRVFEAEGRLLEAHGHDVLRFERHNDDLGRMSKLEAFRKAHWNPETEQDLSRLIEREQPDVLHCANTFPLISPAAYSAARKFGVAVVQTLHNYRLICPKAQLYREERPCEDCIGKTVAWPALLHRCYRGSLAATASVASMSAFHSLRRTWVKDVDRFIAISSFVRKKMVEAGLPADKIVVKPNFVGADPGEGSGRGNYALFAGRLSPEKGVTTVLEAWRLLPLDLQLKVVGQGPLESAVTEAAATDPRISWLGQRPSEEVLDLMGDAVFQIVPSTWPEPFGLTVIEAYAKGTPVIASDAGALSDLVRDGETGRHFTSGDPASLANTVQQTIEAPQQLRSMRQAARAEFEAKYTAEVNYTQLMSIYEAAIEAAGNGVPAQSPVPGGLTAEHHLRRTGP